MNSNLESTHINRNTNDITNDLVDSTIYAVSLADKDMMHSGQATQAFDEEEFTKAIVKEATDLNNARV